MGSRCILYQVVGLHSHPWYIQLIKLDCQLNNWFQCKDGICFTKIWGCHGVKAVWIDLTKNIVISVVTSGVTNSKKFVLID